MTRGPGEPRLEGFEVVQRGHADGTGNVILRSVAESPRVMLKVFRRRHRFVREASQRFATLLERRTSAAPRARCENERRSIEIWSAAGFRVPRLLDRPIPESVGPPALWLEWCEGRSLGAGLTDPAQPTNDRLADIRHLAHDLRRRNRMALDRREIRLVQEHPSPHHVLFTDDDPRPLFLDFENGYRPSYGVMAAIGQEIAAHLRRIVRLGAAPATDVLDHFARGYGDDDLLGEATSIVFGPSGLYRALVRWADLRRRGRHDGKTAIMRSLAERLG